VERAENGGVRLREPHRAQDRCRLPEWRLRRFHRPYFVKPDPVDPAHGTLRYLRQYRDTAGGLRWLSDIVDDDVLSASSGARVDLIVDDRGRPHIAYIAGRDNRAYYATRYDR
jgi:hypothetical protein